MCNVCGFASICVFILHKNCSDHSQSLLASCFHKSTQNGPTLLWPWSNLWSSFFRSKASFKNCGFLLKCSSGQFPSLHEGKRPQNYCYREKKKKEKASDWITFISVWKNGYIYREHKYLWQMPITSALMFGVFVCTCTNSILLREKMHLRQVVHSANHSLNDLYNISVWLDTNGL